MGAKILIVDDEPDVLKTLKTILTNEGFQVRTALSGREAIEIFKAEPFDVVITDIRMPGMDGVEVIKQVSQLNRDVEVIVLTGFATMENAVRALRDNRAFDYLTKPLEDNQMLINSVRRALEKQSLILENKKMQGELFKAKNLESIGVLAGGIAHDFNNLLYIIIGNIELAQDDIKHEIGFLKSLQEAREASLEAIELIKQLITFSKDGTPFKKIGSIGDLIKAVTDFILPGSNIKCDFFIAPDLWPVEFDEGQMKHAIKNVVLNAIESMPDGGTIDIRAENVIINSETAEQTGMLIEGNYVKIDIQDHGAGIPEEYLSKIFDPYFSTKERGTQRGMGLGLAITHSVINKHNGYIVVESDMGVGTTFTMFLPRYEKDVEEVKSDKLSRPKILRN